MPDDRMELPCVKCGNAAVALDLRGALEFVPAKYIVLMRGAARLSGAPIDKESPSLGQDAGQIAQVVGATCISCVDAELAPETAPRVTVENCVFERFASEGGITYIVQPAALPVEPIDNNRGETT